MDFNPKVSIDSIKWERVILSIAGKITGVDPSSISFSLSNGNVSVPIKSVRIIDEYYLIRINVTTANEGCNYLSDGDWSIIAHDELTGTTYQPTVSESVFSDDGIEDEYVYCDDKNVKIERFHKTFSKSATHFYDVKPCLDGKDGFILKVFYQKPIKKNPVVKFIKGYINLFKPMAYAIKKGLFRAVFSISNLFPHSGKVILFTSDSRAELGGNMELVYNRMHERGLDKQFKIKMMFRESIKTRRKIGDKFKMPFVLGRADIIIVDDYNPTVELVKYRPEVKIIQLWHACGAFKTVGFSRLGKTGGPAVTSTIHKKYTHAIASSNHVAKFYAEAFGIEESNVYPTGVPRTDMFFDEDYKERTRKSMYEAFPLAKGKRVILFAPTFRGNGAKSAHYPYGKINMHAIGKYCQESDSVIIFKMHPFVATPLFIPPQYKDVMIDATENREINDILFITDLLITDYSSVIYEASTLNIPMLFYAFDLEQYVSSRDFYEPFDRFVPGKIVQNFGELLKAIEENDFCHEKVAPFRDKNFEFKDGKSTDRVIDWLILGTKE